MKSQHQIRSLLRRANSGDPEYALDPDEREELEAALEQIQDTEVDAWLEANDER